MGLVIGPDGLSLAHIITMMNKIFIYHHWQ